MDDIQDSGDILKALEALKYSLETCLVSTGVSKRKTIGVEPNAYLKGLIDSLDTYLRVEVLNILRSILTIDLQLQCIENIKERISKNSVEYESQVTSLTFK